MIEHKFELFKKNNKFSLEVPRGSRKVELIYTNYENILITKNGGYSDYPNRNIGIVYIPACYGVYELLEIKNYNVYIEFTCKLLEEIEVKKINDYTNKVKNYISNNYPKSEFTISDELRAIWERNKKEQDRIIGVKEE